MEGEDSPTNRTTGGKKRTPECFSSKNAAGPELGAPSGKGGVLSRLRGCGKIVGEGGAPNPQKTAVSTILFV